MLSQIASFFNTKAMNQVIDWASLFLQYLLIATLIYEINAKPIRWGRIILHAALITVSINASRQFYESLMVFFRTPNFSALWYILYALLMFRNPLWLGLLFLLTLFVLRIPRRSLYNQIVVLYCAYLLPMCVAIITDLLLWAVISALKIEFSPENVIMRYFSLFSEGLGLVQTGIIAVGWVFLRRYIRNNPHKIKMYAETQGGSRERTPLFDILKILFIWLVSSGYAYTNTLTSGFFYSVVQVGYIIALIAIYCLFIYLDYYLKLRSIQSQYLLEANTAMFETINAFRGIKHDFNNILQTYDGYFQLEDYAGLRRYHETLRGITIAAGDRLSLQTLFAEKPAILGLITNAMDNAESQGVHFEYQRPELLKEIALPEFDLCRILGILLNNAFEHAAQTEAKTVTLTVREQPNKTGVVILSNSVDGRVDTSELFREGYTTKPGHSGHGLTEVNKMLAGYYGCTILPNCTESTFSMFLNVPLG